MKQEKGKSAAGNEIMRRPATDDDIKAIVIHWDNKHATLDDLMEYVDASGLDQSEKDRIRRIIIENREETKS